MPHYNYKCESCGNILELLGNYNEKEKYVNCNGHHSKYFRIFSPSKNFVLKGKGWGKDNYDKLSKTKKEKDS